MKQLARNLIAYIPGLRHWVARTIFLGPRHNTHRFWGVFHSMAEAKASIPRQLAKGFDTISEEIDETIPARDAEAVRILGALIPSAKRLFDFGGHTGTEFYQYRTAIPYPADFRWTVCDVPYVCKVGRKIAAKRGETQIEFNEDFKTADGTDIFLTCGALQYLEKSLGEMLGELSDRPAHVVINRVPLGETESFYTLQHMGPSVVPYHLINRAEFIRGIEVSGYELVEQWKNDRFCEIILRPDYYVNHYYGFYFKKR